jgi:pentatricopeptide repeat protein
VAPDRSEEDCREMVAQVILRSITMVGSQGRKGKCSYSCSESLIDAGGWYSFFCLGLSSLGSENAQLMSWSLFSGCRGMQGIPISNIRRHGRLWLGDNLNPPWVEAELAAMAPGTVQLSIFSWNSRLARYVKAGQYENTTRLFQQMKQEGMSPDKFTFV